MGPGNKILVHHYMFLKKQMLEPSEEGNDGDNPIEVEMYLLNTRLSMKAVFYSFSSQNCPVNLTLHYYKYHKELKMWSNVLIIGYAIKMPGSNRNNLGCAIDTVFTGGNT